MDTDGDPGHSVTVWLFVLGILVIPGLLIASGPFDRIGASLGTAASVICVAVGWIRVKRRS